LLKCYKGGIERFNYLIVFIKDPFSIIWEQLKALKHHKIKYESQENIDKNNWQFYALELSKNISEDMIYFSSEINKLSEVVKSTNVILISYEQLFIGSKSQFSSLSKMLKLMGLNNNILFERLNCSYSFINYTETRKVSEMINSYKKHPKLLCDMRHELNRKFNKLDILFNEFNCTLYGRNIYILHFQISLIFIIQL
jgi:hypothetical protein